MCKALLVDDEDSILRILAKILELDGFSVVTAGSAVEGAAKLAEERVDVVITDLRMESPLAGFEVVKAARALIPRPAIVILTAFPVPSADWKAAGADAMVLKGANPRGLAAQLKALIKQRV